MDNEDHKGLSPQQRGAAIRWRNPPIAKLSEIDRRALVESVLERYLDDGHLRNIAQDIGISRTGLNWAILKHAPEEWQSAQAARALYELDDAQDELEKATDRDAVARAIGLVKSAQWRLERTCRRLYGETKAEDVRQAVSINIVFSNGAAQSRTIEQDGDKEES